MGEPRQLLNQSTHSSVFDRFERAPWARIGMLVRAGSTHREMVRALGVDIRLLYTVAF